MIFALGVLTGLTVAILIVAVLAYFRRPLVQMLGTAEKQIDLVSPRAKGFIVMPPDESEEARQEIIDENRKKGLDTKISDLS